ncbi:MAG: IclR family transcriptional regulator [Candidatus Sumerlaeota bacterium]
MAGSNLIQSLLRGLDILDLLSASPGGMALRDVAGALDVGPSTAHNLLRTLVARGFVEKTQGRYHLGEHLGHLHARLRAGSYLDACERVLQDLARRFPEATLSYDEMRGADLVVLLRVAPSDPGVVEHPEGRTFGPYTSISGLVMQAFADQEVLSAVRLEHPFSEEGSRLWESFEVLESFRQAVRRQGYGVAPFDDNRTILRMAVPVLNSSGALQGILGLSMQREQRDGAVEKRLARVLQSASTAMRAGGGL